MEEKTGVVVPLSALYTKDCAAVGDFLALKDFADFAEKCGFSVIQLLPVNDTGTQSSPYSGLSAFALHPLYIRIDALPEFAEAFKADRQFAGAYRSFVKEFKYKRRFDYDAVLGEKLRLLHLLYAAIEKKLSAGAKKAAQNVKVVSAAGSGNFADQFQQELAEFVRDNSWVTIYAVYKNLKDAAMQASWKEWDESFRSFSRKQIQTRWNNRALKSSHNFFVWCQMRAAQQFKEAADYVRAKGITLKGDIPILMNEDSADCWGWPEFFNQNLRAGAPPDGENPLGQNWGFPTYNWESIAADGYTWWKHRVQAAAQYYDAFRIDHILGFFRIWAVPARERTAFLGHTAPCATFTRAQLHGIGFDDGRIHWIAEPHIPTKLIEDITWNHDEAVADLSLVCDRLGSEELWNFKKSIQCDSDIYAQTFCDDAAKDGRVKDALAEKWRDRMLIELQEDSFVFVYSYKAASAWGTLSGEEQEKLGRLHDEIAAKEDALWKQQALSVLTPICAASKMTACAEDLGVSLACMPDVLKELSILSLKVVRWTREWGKDGQPYIPFEEYPAQSVCTTSVHDSPTLRQWWDNEKQSAEAFLRAVSADQDEGAKDSMPQAAEPFIAKTAQFCLEQSARTNSAWFVNPLQDYLFLEQKYFLASADDERINIPGSVSSFNWTYRIPVAVEELLKDEILIGKIKAVVAIHGGSKGGNA
ncbi:MAG TPA: 4-alpha-glucanotransferase [Treponema sp.]|nr:4-alpha-glucanotransferase [Treponema sp.]